MLLLLLLFVVETADDDDDDDDDLLILMLMILMLMVLLLLLPPCTFWPAGPLLGVSPLNPAKALGEEERDRGPCRRLPAYLKFTTFYGIFCCSHFSTLVT